MSTKFIDCFESFKPMLTILVSDRGSNLEMTKYCLRNNCMTPNARDVRFHTN